MKNGETTNMDLSGQNVLAMRDAKNALAAGATQVRIGERCVVTPSARDFLRQHDIGLVTGGAVAATPATPARSTGEAAVEPPIKKTRSDANPRLFTTPEAEAVKVEICAVGRKLWNRAVCRRQRRQYLLSHRPQRGDLHADAGEQVRSDSG